MRYLIAVALAALTVAGCASSASHPTATHTAPASPSPAATTQAPPGPQRFIADVQAAGYGSKDVSTSSASLILLSAGKDVCRALSTSQGTNLEGYSTMIESLVKGHGRPSLHQATILVDSAIRNLCPENSNLMPAGAP